MRPPVLAAFSQATWTAVGPKARLLAEGKPELEAVDEAECLDASQDAEVSLSSAISLARVGEDVQVASGEETYSVSRILEDGVSSERARWTEASDFSSRSP
jgi:hypothetical protein